MSHPAIETFKKELRLSIKGGTTRKDFWIFVGISLALTIVIFFIAGIFIGIAPESIAIAAFAIGLAIIPVAYLNIVSIFVIIRRLHDMGYSGWWSLLYWIPTLFFTCFANAGVSEEVASISGGFSWAVYVAFLIVLSFKQDPNSKYL